MVYDLYEQDKYTGQYEVYIRNGKVERLWYYSK